MTVSGQDAADVEIEKNIEQNGTGQHQQNQNGKEVDLCADAFQVLHQLLLLESIAVRGFPDHFQLIFNALDGGVLFLNLRMQLSLVFTKFNQMVFQLFWNGRRRGWLCGGQVAGNRIGGSAVHNGQDLLQDRKGITQGQNRFLQIRGEIGGFLRVCMSRPWVLNPLWQSGGMRKARGIPNGQWGADKPRRIIAGYSAGVVLVGKLCAVPVHFHLTI